MKQFSDALKTALSTRHYMEAELWTWFFASGTQYWTSAGADVTFNGHTFLSGACGIEKGKSHCASSKKDGDTSVEVDTFEVVLHPAGGTATIAGLDVRAAAAALYFSGIRVILQRAYFSAPQAQGGTLIDAYTVFDGYAGQVKPNSLSVELTIESPMSKGTEPVPRRLIQPACPFVFGDQDCKATVPTCTGTVASGTVTTVTVATFDPKMVPGSTLTFTSGTLSGVAVMISSVSGSTLTLDQALGAAPVNGTTFLVTRACDKTRATCRYLGNILNFGGRPDAPNQSVMKNAGVA